MTTEKPNVMCRVEALEGEVKAIQELSSILEKEHRLKYDQLADVEVKIRDIKEKATSRPGGRLTSFVILLTCGLVIATCAVLILNNNLNL